MPTQQKIKTKGLGIIITLMIDECKNKNKQANMLDDG
jgi:hypothetical protein